MAKAALRRKKTHEQALDQTIAQIGTLEQQINSIESANINRETLAAMEKASQAMKHIHGKLTPEKVDETMCVPLNPQYRCISSPDPFVLTRFFQGDTTGPERAQPGDCGCDYGRNDRRAGGRRLLGGRAGPASAGAAG